MSANKEHGHTQQSNNPQGVESLTLSLQQIAAAANQNTEQFESQKKYIYIS